MIQCCARVTTYEGLASFSHQCSRRGVVQVYGRWYCRQHDPEAMARKRDERRAEWDRKWDIAKKERAKDAAAKSFVEACLGTHIDGSLTICDETCSAFRALLNAHAELSPASESGSGGTHELSGKEKK